jgi:4-hydroxy-4-methyl-2-oxoglutarate aldolase
MSLSLMDRLARLDTCAVSDALDRLGTPGTAGGLTALSTAKRIAGRCITVQLGPDDGTSHKRHLCTAAVEAGGSGQVIVVAHDGRLDVAGWGGLLSLGASLRGVEGTVIDGACRDIDESRELAFPLYGRAGVPTTARGRIVEKAWNIPVTICGVPVAPGDLVIADGSGVVFVPAASAEEAVKAAERIAARERLMAADLRAGQPISQVMGTDYENMLTTS